MVTPPSRVPRAPRSPMPSAAICRIIARCTRRSWVSQPLFGRVLDMALPKIISVDDHVVEPPHVWQTWLPEKFRAGPELLDREPAAKLDVDLGAHNLFECLAHGVDHRFVAHVGQRALGAAPCHRLALRAPVVTRPSSDGRNFGTVRGLLPVDLDGQLPADRGLPLEG